MYKILLDKTCFDSEYISIFTKMYILFFISIILTSITICSQISTKEISDVIVKNSQICKSNRLVTYCTYVTTVITFHL